MNKMLKRGLFVLLIIVALLFSVASYASTNYTGNMLIIINDTANEMLGLAYDINQLEIGEISTSTFINRIEIKKANALGNLEAIIKAADNAPDEEFHAEFVSVISSWYVVTNLIEKGIRNGDIGKINGATQVMDYINNKLDELTTQLESGDAQL